MRLRKPIVMITIMIVRREKEIIALKETSSIFENETARILRQSRFKNQLEVFFLILKSF